VREFPLEPFLKDMGTLIDRGTRTFKFLDRSFNLNIEREKSIMEFFLERINNLCVHFEMVPFRFPEALRELLRRFPPGSLRLEVGIQTFNPQTAALIHRAGSLADPELRTEGSPQADPKSPLADSKISCEIETLEFLRRETNAIIHADLIAGLPGEDIVSFGAGFDRLWQALSGASSNVLDAPCEASFEIQLGILKCLPGTPIVRHNETHGMRYSPEPPYEVIETAALPAAELGRIKNFARFWEIIVNRNPFPDLLPSLLTPGLPAFDKFMILSGRLLENFGKNWGIDRQELRNYLINS